MNHLNVRRIMQAAGLMLALVLGIVLLPAVLALSPIPLGWNATLSR